MFFLQQHAWVVAIFTMITTTYRSTYSLHYLNTLQKQHVDITTITRCGYLRPCVTVYVHKTVCVGKCECRFVYSHTPTLLPGLSLFWVMPWPARSTRQFWSDPFNSVVTGCLIILYPSMRVCKVNRRSVKWKRSFTSLHPQPKSSLKVPLQLSFHALDVRVKRGSDILS